MLGTASETLKNVNSEARVLEARVVQVQMENEAKMAKQKSVYEQKLKVQEEQNRALVAANANISSEIAALKTNTTALKKHSEDLIEGDKLMRQELRVLQSRLGTARDYIQTSLVRTDDSKAPELDALEETLVTPTEETGHVGRKEKHHRQFLEVGAQQGEKEEKGVQQDKAKGAEDDKDDEDADDEDEQDDDDDDKSEEDDIQGQAASLLSIARRTHRVKGRAAEAAHDEAAKPKRPLEANPGDLLLTLSKGVIELQRQEQQSEGRLRVMFLSEFEAGTERHAALLAQQKELNNTRSSLVKMQARLRTADAHLEATKAELRQRLRGLGLFAQRLGHLALAPTDEAQRLLKALPESVQAGGTRSGRA